MYAVHKTIGYLVVERSLIVHALWKEISANCSFSEYCMYNTHYSQIIYSFLLGDR